MKVSHDFEPWWLDQGSLFAHPGRIPTEMVARYGANTTVLEQRDRLVWSKLRGFR
jgi:hypothetical protein